MKAYLLVHSDALTPDHVQSVLTTTQAVVTWLSPLPYSAIVLSNLTVNELTAVLEWHLGRTWFILTELNSSAVNGLLPPAVWEYVQDPTNAWTKKIMAQLEASSTSVVPVREQSPMPTREWPTPLHLPPPPKHIGPSRPPLSPTDQKKRK